MDGDLVEAVGFLREFNEVVGVDDDVTKVETAESFFVHGADELILQVLTS